LFSFLRHGPSGSWRDREGEVIGNTSKSTKLELDGFDGNSDARGSEGSDTVIA
jgi:hypothetical protein